ncbi:MAG TPA: tetratricopeptide repeat protein [Anaeromyxobacter sp.]
MTDRYLGFPFRDADLTEDVDLGVERRKEVLFADGHLATWTHWQALGIPWDAPAGAAKAAYLGLVKVFHPDRYAGKRLGSYRARLDRIFRRITEARDVLVDDVRRAAYVRSSAPPEEVTRIEARKLDDERRAEERRARLGRSSPLLQRAGRVGELVERGKKAFAEGRFQQAANDLLVSQGLDPRNPEVAALAAEAKRRATLGKIADLLRRAAEEEGRGKLGAAVDLYREAVEVDPSSVRAAAEAARAIADAGDAAGARALADAALRLGPRSGLAHEALGRVLEAEGNKKEARQALERAIELDPSLERAKQRLKKLKWGIFG